MDGDHLHNKSNPRGIHEHKKLFVFSIFALIIAFGAYSSIQSPDVAFEVIVNNTNLAPTIDPSIPGTGERMEGNVYYANSSSIVAYFFWHTISNNDMDANVSINGTIIWDGNLRLPGIVDDHMSATIIIPKGANYSMLNNSAVHHYEWREYPILSGKNGTLSINQSIFNSYTNISGGSNLTNTTVNFYSGNSSNLTGNINVSILPFDTCTTPSPVQWSWWNGSHLLCYNYADDDTAYLKIIDLNSTVDRNHANQTNLNMSKSGHVFDSDINFTNDGRSIRSSNKSINITMNDDTTGLGNFLLRFSVKNLTNSVTISISQFFTISTVSDGTTSSQLTQSTTGFEFTKNITVDSQSNSSGNSTMCVSSSGLLYRCGLNLNSSITYNYSKVYTIYGSVNANGTVRTGQPAFWSQRNSTGHYFVVFNSSFSALKTIHLTPHSTVANAVNGISVDDNACGSTKNYFCVAYTNGASTTYIDNVFEFSVIGE
jgi:hypothetical protein